MSMPRPDEAAKAFFHSVLPADPRIQARPMFGNLAGFVNGNMFTGLFGNEIFVRLPEAERVRLVTEEGASPFEPMVGRPMKEYVSLPAAWAEEPDKVRHWVERSLAWASELPEKGTEKSTAKKKAPK